MTTRTMRVTGDLSTLPSSANGARGLPWSANLGFMVIEGAGFALAVGAYLYLRSRSPSWPPAGDALPSLGWSGVLTVGLLASVVPNLWVARRAKAKDEHGVRSGVLAMVLVGVLLCVVRGFEFAHLGVHWTHDAYGSVVWMLMLLHTSHLVTDLGESCVLSLWLYTHEVGDDQFADVEDNTVYWNFVIVAWLPIYALLYWTPRLT